MSVESAQEWEGRELGTRTISYDERDAILYALAVGALPTELDLVFEDRLRVLPSFGLALAQWAPDTLAGRVFGDGSVHGSQTLDVKAPLPRLGEVTMTAHVGRVLDKGSAAIVDVIVESDYFIATWTIFAPGAGGFGGDRGPSRVAPVPFVDPLEIAFVTAANQALLYRLTGDRHTIHVDPEAAAAIGAPRPILHGLATLAASTLPIAREIGAHPADLKHLEGRFTAQVLPGDELVISYEDKRFAVDDASQRVISDGVVSFG